MEFGINNKKKTIDVVWNGPDEQLCKKLVISSLSQTRSLKIYLFCPKMPTNHTLCLVNRLRRVWNETVGRSSMKAYESLERVNMGNQLLTEDDKLIQILEFLALDDVAPDIDLLAVKKWESEHRENTIWAFCFAPDDTDHFLNNVRINNDILCYGRNGDDSL